MQITQFLRRAARLHPHRAAFRVNDRSRTWGEALTRTPRLAAVLQAQGIEPGDRVAVLAMNSDTYAELLYAIPWAGAVVVPLNIRLAVLENVYALTHCGAKVLFVDETFADVAIQLAAQCPSIRQVLYIGARTGSSCMPMA